jgi:hypothetical protein
VFPEAFAPAALWEFAVVFPIVQRFTGFDVLARKAAAAAWLLGSVLFGVNAAVAYHVIDHGPLLLLARDDPGNAFWHLFVLALLPGAAAILVRARRAPAAERRKVLRFAGSIAAGTAPLLVCGVIRMALPRVNDWFLTAISPSRLWIDRLIVGALTAMPILTTTALVADRPFERQVPILKSMRDRFARTVAAVAIVTPLAALSVLLYRFRRVAIADFIVQSRAWLLLPCAAAGGLLAARARLREALAARGVRRAAGHQEHLAAALERVRVARSQREIGAVLSRELRRGAAAATTRILVARSSGGGQTITFVDVARGVGSFAHDSVLLAMLGETAVPLDLSSDGPLLRLIPDADRDWVTANGVALMAPLKRRDGTIAAIVVCGAKCGGRPFDRRDRWFISTLIIGAAAAWGAAEFGRLDGADDQDDVAAESRDDTAFECVRCGLLTESRPVPCSCGSDTVVAALPRHLAGKFVVVRRIGAGGMGVVYLARDTTLDRDVALKTLPDLRDGTVARLRDEARAMAVLNHGSLATIYGLEFWRRTPILVVEYLPGGTLARRLERGPMSPPAVVAIGIQLARVLAYMHARGVLHRDLKPSNIAFTAAGAPKLLDFGLAAAITEPSIELPSRPDIGDARPAGTPGYLPPESYRGAPPEPAVDLWALSVVLLEAIAGRNLLETAASDRAIRRALHVHLVGVCAGRRDRLAPLTAFFERALAVRTDVRFHSSVEMQSALESLADAFVDS